MKQRDKRVLVGLLVLIAIFALWKVGLFSLTGISEVPVIINVGQKDATPQIYYIIRGTIGVRTDAFQIVLPKDKEIDLGNGQYIRNSKEVVVKIEPLNPTQKTTLIQSSILKYFSYRGVAGFGDQYTAPEYYDVQGGMWLTTANYRISTYVDGSQITLKDVPINYQSPQEVTIGNIYIENLGILPNGLSVPSGSYVVVYDPYGNYQLFESYKFSNQIERTNQWVGDYGWIGDYSWQWHWQKASEIGVLPNVVNTIGTVSYDYSGGKPNNINLKLPIGSYSGEILIYIPKELADGIIFIKQQSKAVITSYPNIPTIFEGQSTDYTVLVKNVGTSDYIGVSMDCGASYSVQGNTRVLFNVNEEKPFTFKLTALSTDRDIQTSCSVLADGTAFVGGDDMKTVYGTIRNVISPTPTPTVSPTPSPTPTPPSTCYINTGTMCLDFFVWLFLFALVIGVAYGYSQKGGDVGTSIIISVVVSCIFVLAVIGIAMFMNALVSLPIIGGLFSGLVNSVNSILANIVVSVILFATGMILGTFIGDKLERG